MARNKRTLAEVDPNASSAPAAKKPSVGGALGKENQHFKSKTVAELATMLKERGLPHTGKKAELVQRLEDTSKTISRAGEATTPSDDSHKTSETALKDTSTWDFVTMCRSWDDIVAEKQAKQAINENYDADEEVKKEANRCGNGDCMCKKSPKDFPDWKWLITRQGYAMVLHLKVEAQKRDQDLFGQYHYNDYSAYGFQEVVENHLVSFNKEYTKKKLDPIALWHHIECFAHFIPGDQYWYNCEDGECVAKTMQLIGHAVHATIKVLSSHDLFRPGSPIKDLSLVFGLLVSAAISWCGSYEEPELSWVQAMISKAKEHEIVIASTPFGVAKDVKKFEEVEYGEDAPDWDGFDWKKEFKAFSQMYRKAGSSRIGGTYYDLTKKKRSTYITVGPGLGPY